MATRKKPESKMQATTLRHLWLAGLGLAETARQSSLLAANDASERLEVLKKRAGLIASGTQANLSGGFATAREQGGTRAGQFSAEVDARLAPVLAKLGLKPAQEPRARKASRKTSAARTASGARKPATRRKPG